VDLARPLAAVADLPPGPLRDRTGPPPVLGHPHDRIVAAGEGDLRGRWCLVALTRRADAARRYARLSCPTWFPGQRVEFRAAPDIERLGPGIWCRWLPAPDGPIGG
jgi:hypothetical protein